MTKDYTHNHLQDKKISIFQPIDGYRASIDAVMISSAVSNVKKGDNILDVGSGTGAISLCLAHKFQNIASQIIGLETQTRLFELSNMSSKENGFDSFLSYINFDIRNKIDEKTIIKPISFSHVVTNPPYSQSDMESPNKSKATAHNHQDFSLESWIKFCIKMMKPKGYFYMINRAEAVDEILSVIRKGKLGNIKIVPIQSKENEDAKRVIIIAQKGSKTSTVIKRPIIVHDETGGYSNKTDNIFRNSASLLED